MGKYRSRVEIVADILEVASDGALKTHIMYKCNLSYKLLEQFKAYVQHSEEVRQEVTKVNNERALLEDFIRNEDSR